MKTPNQALAAHGSEGVVLLGVLASNVPSPLPGLVTARFTNTLVTLREWLNTFIRYDCDSVCRECTYLSSLLGMKNISGRMM